MLLFGLYSLNLFLFCFGGFDVKWIFFLLVSNVILGCFLFVYYFTYFLKLFIYLSIYLIFIFLFSFLYWEEEWGGGVLLLFVSKHGK
jgi:hypothetical protein